MQRDGLAVWYTLQDVPRVLILARRNAADILEAEVCEPRIIHLRECQRGFLILRGLFHRELALAGLVELTVIVSDPVKSLLFETVALLAGDGVGIPPARQAEGVIALTGLGRGSFLVVIVKAGDRHSRASDGVAVCVRQVEHDRVLHRLRGGHFHVDDHRLVRLDHLDDYLLHVLVPLHRDGVHILAGAEHEVIVALRVRDELIVGVAQRQRGVRQIDTGVGDGKAYLVNALLHGEVHGVNGAQLGCRARRGEDERMLAHGVRREGINGSLDRLLLAAVHRDGVG